MIRTLAVMLRDARRASAKHRWVRCIGGRSGKLVRYAGPALEILTAITKTPEKWRETRQRSCYIDGL